MKTAEQWIQAVMKKYECTPYGAAKLIGIEPSSVYHYMAGDRRGFDAYAAVRVAELLGEVPLRVIASAEAERAKSDEKRTFWKRLAASVVLGTAAASASSLPAPAEAAQASAESRSDIMLNRRTGRRSRHSRSPGAFSGMAAAARALLGQPSRNIAAP